MNAYVVTAGSGDAELLTKILNAADVDSVLVTPAGARSAVLPLARSILSRRNRPVAVVLDSDTISWEGMDEQRRTYGDLLRAASNRVPFRVFLAQPALERVLFDASDTLSGILGVPIDEAAVDQAQFRPQQVLDRLLEKSGRGESRATFIEGIGPEAAREFARLPFFRSIIEFLEHPTVEHESEALLT